MFLGTHTPRLDDKGRIFLPAKYRDELAEGLVLTKGQERCLYVFPESEFGRITEALRTAPVTSKAVRDYSRVFFASASDEIPDKQGRLTSLPRRQAAAMAISAVPISAIARMGTWPGRHASGRFPFCRLRRRVRPLSEGDRCPPRGQDICRS